MRALDRFQISIRLGLVLGVVALVLLTATLVHVPWSVTARGNVTDLALRLNTEVIDGVSAKMSALLDDAVATEQILADNIVGGSVNIEDAGARKTLFQSFMTEHQTLSSIEFGWLDDRSSAARRLSNGALVTRETGPRTDGSDVIGEFWFKQAFETAGASWSDIYPMRDSGRLGFTVVSAVKISEEPLGVLAVSMELEEISRFLSGIKTSPHAGIFLTNTYRELVAVQRQSVPMTMTQTHGTAVTELEDGPSPLLKIAADALTDKGVVLPTLNGPRQLTYTDPISHAAYFVTVAPLSQMGLIVGLVVPESDVLGAIDQNTTRLSYALLGFVVLIAALVAILATRTLAKPLVAVTRNARLLGDFRFDDIRPVSSQLTEISTLSGAISQMSASLASFKKYIPTEVVRTLFAQGIEAELGGERRELTIFFMDLMNFTGISEALGEGLIPFIGEYLSDMSDVVKENGGTIDKYIGDAVMAFWGAPIANEKHALAACRAALVCQERLRVLREESRLKHRGKLRARIGLNTGNVLVGNIGSRERLNYTVIGDPVNVASRLESLNKLYESEILIGEDTHAGAKDHIIARRLDRVAVYGKTMGVEIFELLALKEAASPDLIQWVQTYERGLTAMRARAWDEARELFSHVIELRGGHDAPSQLMIHRIQEFLSKPPKADWNGVLLLSEK